MDTLLFATNNKNKAREVEEALKKINLSRKMGLKDYGEAKKLKNV